MQLLHTPNYNNNGTLCGAPRATNTNKVDRNRPQCAKCVRVMRIIATSKPRMTPTLRDFRPSDYPNPTVHTVYGGKAAPGERYRKHAARV